MTDTLVVDASALLSLCFEDEDWEYGRKVLTACDAGVALVAPSIWPLEILNAVVGGERRGRLDRAAAGRFLHSVSSLGVSLDTLGLADAMVDTLALARRHGLTAYDAAYLELALRRGLAIASLDRQLRHACAAAGVQVW